MNKQLNYLTLLALFATVLFPSSGIANTLDLMTAYEEAKVRDPELAAARHEFRAGNQRLQQSYAANLPQIKLESNWSLNYQDGSNTEFRMEEYPAHNYALTVSQPLVNAQALYGVSQAKVYIKQNAVRYTKKRQDFVIRIAEIYFSALAAQKSLKVAKAQTSSFQQSYDRSVAQFSVGTTTITDKLEAKARLDLAKAEEISAENDLAVAMTTLHTMIGLPAESLADIHESTPLKAFPVENLDQWLTKAKANNLDNTIHRHGIRISKLEYHRAVAAHYPTLNLMGSIGYNESRNYFFGERETKSDEASLTLQLNVPIFAGRYNRSKTYEARELKRAQHQVLAMSEEKTAIETKRAFLDVSNGHTRINALSQALISHQSSLEAMEDGLRAGVRTNLDILDSKQRLFSTQRDYYAARYQYLIDYLRLQLLVGALNESHIVNMNKLLKN